MSSFFPASPLQPGIDMRVVRLLRYHLSWGQIPLTPPNTRIIFAIVFSLFSPLVPAASQAAQPNIILVMADDQGWGETSYRGHPVFKSPNLDRMSEHGLRFDRFYAGAPVCSPTRASVLTGRSNNRTGVESHGFALRLQEKTLAVALRQAGYSTGHFGKWHLNGLRGPGVPVLASDSHHPGVFGFDEWLSVTNFFDRNPILSRRGEFEEYEGDSSEIIVEQALSFIAQQAQAKQPFFTVIWFGTPHSPFMASEKDMAGFEALAQSSRHHYGELVAMDRSIGTLRSRLRQLGIAEETLVWFCSDNGGLPKITPGTVGGLRGFKGSLYEGGLRVPGIIEWPKGIPTPRVTEYPAVTMDIFPTIADIVGLKSETWLQPQDGLSLMPLFSGEIGERKKPIPFNCFGDTALVDNNYKLIHLGRQGGQFELYDLLNDPAETRNIVNEETEVTHRLKGLMSAWQRELAASLSGKDYPESRVNPGEPKPRHWKDIGDYEPYFDAWRDRPEFKSVLGNK